MLHLLDSSSHMFPLRPSILATNTLLVRSWEHTRQCYKGTK